LNPSPEAGNGQAGPVSGLVAARLIAPSQNVTFQWLLQPALMRFTVAGAVTD
jgi:hypothetical protein